MIAAPGIGVVLEDIGGEVAENGLPSRPIAAVVSDEEIRPLVRIWTLINFAGSIYARDCRPDCSGDRVRKATYLLISVNSESAAAPGSTIPSRSRPLQIQIEPVQTQSIGASAAPVHIGERLVLIGIGLVSSK